jgi:hypothetical protein
MNDGQHASCFNLNHFPPHINVFARKDLSRPFFRLHDNIKIFCSQKADGFKNVKLVKRIEKNYLCNGQW